jgi:hypothetical protein
VDFLAWWGGLASIVIGVVVVVVVAAMPFLVWGTHTKMRELDSRLSSLGTRLSRLDEMVSDTKMSAVYARISLEGIEQMLQDLGRTSFTEETLAVLEEIKKRRIGVLTDHVVERFGSHPGAKVEDERAAPRP